MKRQKGFTLVELLIWIGILSIIGILTFDYDKDGLKVRISLGAPKSELLSEEVKTPKFSGDVK